MDDVEFEFLSHLRLQMKDYSQSNPVCDDPAYPSGVLKMMPSLDYLDEEEVTFLKEVSALYMPKYQAMMQKFKKGELTPNKIQLLTAQAATRMTTPSRRIVSPALNENHTTDVDTTHQETSSSTKTKQKSIQMFMESEERHGFSYIEDPKHPTLPPTVLSPPMSSPHSPSLPLPPPLSSSSSPLPPVKLQKEEPVVKKKDVKVEEVLQVDKVDQVEENVHASTPLQKSSFQSVEVSKKKKKKKMMKKKKSEIDIHGKNNSYENEEKEEKEEEEEEEEEDSLNESTNKTKKKSTHCSSSKRIYMIHQSTNTE
jgi:hypothetical protein